MRGTGAESILGHVRQALHQFDLQCQGLWSALSTEVEGACNTKQEGNDRVGTGEMHSKIRVAAYRQQDNPMEVREPYITCNLVNLVYESLFDSGLEGDRRPEIWRPSSGEPDIFMAGPIAVAVGEGIHETVRRGISGLLIEGLDSCRARALALEGMFLDLGYLSTVVGQVLSETTEVQVRKGICPKCPYPEALLALLSESSQGSVNESSRR